MTSSTFWRKHRTAFFAMGLVLMAPSGALAQDSTATFEPATITLTLADGEERQYQVNDVSVYVSTTAGYDSVPATTDFSLSLSTLMPIDAELLQWASQAPGKTKQPRNLTITTTVSGADGESREMRYEITEARVTSVSMTHSTYSQASVSLSVAADTLAIDGIAMN